MALVLEKYYSGLVIHKFIKIPLCKYNSQYTINITNCGI